MPPNPTPSQALACGEFGGLSLVVPGHIWAERGRGYNDAASPADLTFMYAQYADQVRTLRDKRGLSACVFTELTDVETEVNGLLTYDRLPKVPAADLFPATTFQMVMPTYRPVVPTSEAQPQQWQYQFAAPAKEWAAADFVDKGWKTGSAPFAEADGGQTKWTTPDVWMRRHFNPGPLTADQIAKLFVRDRHAFDMEVYVNGELACDQRRAVFGYRIHTLLPAGRAAVKPGADNVLAVHCSTKGHARNVAESPFIDVGLCEQLP